MRQSQLLGAHVKLALGISTKNLVSQARTAIGCIVWRHNVTSLKLLSIYLLHLFYLLNIIWFQNVEPFFSKIILKTVYDHFGQKV